MIRHTAFAAVSATLLCTACSTAPEQTSEYRERPIYRTGSNIPAKDYGADNVEVRGAEVINPVNRPMGNVMGRKPGG